MATWPTTLPLPLLSGGAAQSLVLAEPDMGAGLRAPQVRSSYVPQSFDAAWVLTRPQARDLWRFARDSGDAWFTLDVLAIGEDAQASSALARFAGPLAWSLRADSIVDASAPLEVIPL